MASSVINMIDKTPLITVEGLPQTGDITQAIKNFFNSAPGTSIPSIARFYWNGWRFAFLFKSPDGNTGVVLLLNFSSTATSLPYFRRYEGVWYESYIQLS